MSDRPRLLVATPSADVYGSDLQLLASIAALIERGWDVVVTTPAHGPLEAKIRDLGADVQLVDYPVLRRAGTSLRGGARLLVDGAKAAIGLRKTIRRLRPDVVYVNTVTLPWWLVSSRLCRTPAVCHVHEAEASGPAPVRFALYAPLLLASAVIVNSTAAMAATTGVVPRLSRRARVIFNGVPGPDRAVPAPASDLRPFRLVCVGRLSPRKQTDVALEATALLRTGGHDVVLEVCGTPFTGFEWFEEQLRTRAEQPDLRGSVTFSGYVSPAFDAFHRAHAALAPSAIESFGNVVVEAQLAGRPVIAAAAMGHLESVQHDDTGLLVEPGSSDAMADAVLRLMTDQDLFERLAGAGRQRAAREYDPARYRAEIAATVRSVVRGSASV